MARIELKSSGVVFDEKEHRYFLGDKELSGITKVIHNQLFPDEFKGIPEHRLENAAQYGKDVHKSLEDFDSEWTNDGTIELQDYISICKEYGLVHEASEYLITDGEHYASACDKVYRTSDNTFSIGDIKTYYGKIDGDKLLKCRFQLSIYAYLLEFQNKKAKVDRLFIIHLRNKKKEDGTFDHIKEIIFVDRIPSEIVKDLLDCETRGEKFKNPFAIPTELCAQISRIKELMLLKTKTEEELAELKADLLETMEFLDVKTWTTDEVRLTRKLPSTRASFDLKSFKAGHPEINDYEDYMKTSSIAGSLQVSVA